MSKPTPSTSLLAYNVSVARASGNTAAEAMTNLLETTSAQETSINAARSRERLVEHRGLQYSALGRSQIALQDFKFNIVYGVVFPSCGSPSIILPTPEGGELQSQHWTILSWLHGTEIRKPVNRNHVHQH
jgi:hypothetical protein